MVEANPGYQVKRNGMPTPAVTSTALTRVVDAHAGRKESAMP